MSFISGEYIFSVWIDIWFIFYYISINTFHNSYILDHYLNPKLALYVALLQNFYTCIMMLFKNVQSIVILKYIFIMSFMKIIPLFLLRNKSLHFQNNIPITMGIFGMYLVFLYSNGKTIFQTYKEITESIMANNTNTPFFWFLNTYFGI